MEKAFDSRYCQRAKRYNGDSVVQRIEKPRKVKELAASQPASQPNKTGG